MRVENMAASEGFQHIVSADWVRDHLAEATGRSLRIVDVTLGAEDKYKKCHIPGAVFFDITHKAVNTEYYRRNIPSSEHFTEAARAAGIDRDTHVVICDASGTNGFYFGGRAWWMFYLHGHDKVSVLNGGLEKWLQLGYPTSTEVPLYKEGDFSASRRDELLLRYEDVLENVASRRMRHVDTRPADQFPGDDKDPRSGHIPGSVSLPHPELLDSNTGLLKSLDDIQQILREKQVDLAQPTLCSCNTATSAATLALIAKALGKPDVPLYLGSFQEWKRRADPQLIEK